MSNTFDSIKQGLEEAVIFAKGEKITAVVHKMAPIDVKSVRANVGMSQSEFARAFGIHVSTLRHWERGNRTPRGAALTLLNVVAREPKMVLKALSC